MRVHALHCDYIAIWIAHSMHKYTGQTIMCLRIENVHLWPSSRALMMPPSVPTPVGLGCRASNHRIIKHFEEGSSRGGRILTIHQAIHRTSALSHGWNAGAVAGCKCWVPSSARGAGVAKDTRLTAKHILFSSSAMETHIPWKECIQHLSTGIQRRSYLSTFSFGK